MTNQKRGDTKKYLLEMVYFWLYVLIYDLLYIIINS